MAHIIILFIIFIFITIINPGGQVVADDGSHAPCGAEETVLAAPLFVARSLSVA
jgi:hypothetical protein